MSVPIYSVFNQFSEFSELNVTSQVFLGDGSTEEQFKYFMIKCFNMMFIENINQPMFLY